MYFLSAFLWKHIIFYLDIKDTVSLSRVNSELYHVTSEIIYKYRFTNIKSPIILVKWTSECEIATHNFYKYSYTNHFRFNYISDTMQSIAGHNMIRKNKTKLVQYKIYLNNYDSRNESAITYATLNYQFGYGRCSIDIDSISADVINRIYYDGVESNPLLICNVESLTIKNVEFGYGDICIVNAKQCRFVQCQFICNNSIKMDLIDNLMLEKNTFAKGCVLTINLSDNNIINICNNKFDGKAEDDLSSLVRMDYKPSELTICNNIFNASSLIFKQADVSISINSNQGQYF